MLLLCIKGVSYPLQCTTQPVLCMGDRVGSWIGYKWGNRSYWCHLVVEGENFVSKKTGIALPIGAVAYLPRHKGELPYTNENDIKTVWELEGCSYTFANGYAPRTQTKEKGFGFGVLKEVIENDIAFSKSAETLPTMLFSANSIFKDDYIRKNKQWTPYQAKLLKDKDLFLTRSNPTEAVRQELEHLSNDDMKTLLVALGNDHLINKSMNDLATANARYMLGDIIGLSLWLTIQQDKPLENNEWIPFLKRVRKLSRVA